MEKRSRRDKLGLALAGGGFRASLFHVGVFRRLAELDLLRYVEAISAVSGGSIVATLYALLLKRDLERPENNGRLNQVQYGRIVDDLERRLCLGIQKNLRTRLLINPLNVLQGISSGDSLSRAMADLYERHLYRETIAELSDVELVKGRMRLQDIKIKPGGRRISDLDYADLDSYNRAQVAEGGSVVTKLILNATSLNSGSRFWFSASEIGEWDNGYLHAGDAALIRDTVKPQVERARRRGASAPPAMHDGGVGASVDWWISDGQRDRLPARWLKLFNAWHDFFAHADNRSDTLDALLTCKFGALRPARRAAWYLRHWQGSPEDGTFGGLTQAEHRMILADKLAGICHQYAEQVRAWFDTLEQLGGFADLCDFLDDIYLVRSADYLHVQAGEHLAEFPLSHAVAASANFPPVFAPFQLTTFYDDLHISRLGLTDGGVYDNLGVIGVLDEDCNFIVSSDTGMPSEPKQRVSPGRVGMIAGLLSLVMDDNARQTREILLERHRVTAGLDSIPCLPGAQLSQPVRAALEEVSLTRDIVGLAAFKIDSAEVCEREAGGRAEERPYSATEIARIRTDLDAFGDIEADALIGQGYINAGVFLERWFTIDTDKGVPKHMVCRYGADAQNYPYRGAASANGNPPPPRNCPRRPSKTLVSQTLRAAQSRLPHVFRIWASPWCWLAWLSLLALLTGGWYALEGRSVDVAATLQTLIVRGLFLHELGLDGPTSWHRLLATVGVVIALAVVFMLLAKAWFPLFEHLRKRGYTSVARYMAYIGRWPRLIRAFASSLVYKVVIMLIALLVYLYSRLYLLATNLGPWGRSCREHRTDQ